MSELDVNKDPELTEFAKFITFSVHDLRSAISDIAGWAEIIQETAITGVIAFEFEPRTVGDVMQRISHDCKVALEISRKIQDTIRDLDGKADSEEQSNSQTDLPNPWQNGSD